MLNFKFFFFFFSFLQIQRNRAIHWSLEIVLSVYNTKMTGEEFKLAVESNIRIKSDGWAKDLHTYDIGVILEPAKEGYYADGDVVDLYCLKFDPKYREDAYTIPGYGIKVSNATQARTFFGVPQTSLMFGALGESVCT